MSQSPRLSESEKAQDSSQTQQPLSVPVMLLFTALDTTWRTFAPTLGGTFLGIGIDTWLGTGPFGVITCLILGTILSIILIRRQLINVRKPLK